MSTTDELRRMLDERGISYINVESIDGSYWGIRWFVGDNISAEWRENGERHGLLAVNIAPEQAIAATLGGGDSSRYAKLFGTPERAARTLSPDDMSCRRCLLHDHCKDECLIDDYDALLEWLRGDAE